MRLFIAVMLSDEMKSSVISTMHGLKKAGVKGSFVPAQNLHLTLAFLGETEDPAVVKEAMKTVKYKPFRLSLSGIGNFGDRVWIGLKGNQGLAQLGRSVREALDASGIEYDRKEFSPHITIIRKASGKWQQAAEPKGDMLVKRVSLMKSALKDGKCVYTEIFSI